MNFMRAVRGDRLVARAKIDRAGEVLLFASGPILDASGVICASSAGLLRLSELTWAGGESPAIN